MSSSRNASALGRPGSSPHSIAESGVGTIAASETNFNPAAVAGEVAEDLAMSMLDKALNNDMTSGQAEAISTENDFLKMQNEQLHAQLASARSERDEVESRYKAAMGSADDRTRQADLDAKAQKTLRSDLDTTNRQLAMVENNLVASQTRRVQLEEELTNCKRELMTSQNDCGALQQEITITNQRKPPPLTEGQDYEMERNILKDSVARLEHQLTVTQNQLTGLQARHAEAQAIIAEQSDMAMRKDGSTAAPTMELVAESSEEKPLLAAAYQQISVLNTQLAHLYTELTMARTEVQRLRSEQSAQGGGRLGPAGGDGGNEAELMKQSQQIADLVSDIRHLQLDLEYHQQKLDQMIEEKQQMMRDLKKSQEECADAKRQIEEKDQLLRHKDVDLRQMKDDMRSPRGVNAQTGEVEGDGMLAALRSEAAAKDSALIVSHYELHKEKLLRDRLEQKNLKLMERMQKLMMVVETMRKENVTLERNLVAREQNCETKEQQLRQVKNRAKQLQKIAKAAQSGDSKGGSKTLLELASPGQGGSGGLPPLRPSSGASTPRTPRAPPSPYGTR